ncbi:Actin-related protein 7 [Bienertia sinuspersici]
MEAVVVDAGSQYLKAGFAVPDQPPPLVHSLYWAVVVAVFSGWGGGRGVFVVRQVIPTQMKKVLEDSSTVNALPMGDITVDPIVRGFVRDWDAVEDLLHHVLYTGLGWEMGNEGQILFTDPLLTPKALREQLVQLLFETFNVSGFYAAEQGVLSLYAVGRISGCTVDVGHGKIDIAPVIEGAVHHIASRRFEVGGIDLTKLLADELGKSNPEVNLKLSDVERLKEKYCSSAEDELAYEKLKHNSQKEQHTLPDGQVITIGREKYIVGEALFQPSILGLEALGIVEQLVHSISSVSSENHRQLLENTVLHGNVVAENDYLWYSLESAIVNAAFSNCDDACALDMRGRGVNGWRTVKMRGIVGCEGLVKRKAVYVYFRSQTLGQDSRFEDRFQKEASMSNSAIRPSLVKPPEYMPENLSKYSAWIGGAILAKVVFPQNQHVTKADYDETGPSIVHRKCF